MDPLVSGERTAIPRRKVILVVEEDFLTRWSAAEYLRETGFAVIEAINSAEDFMHARPCGRNASTVRDERRRHGLCDVPISNEQGCLGQFGF